MANRLPPELLREVFPLCLLNDPDSPCFLSSVCQRWRDIAFDTPTLWTSLVLRCSDPQDLPALRCKADLWIARSHPLEIDAVIHYASRQDLVFTLFSFVAPSFGRWRTYRFEGTTWKEAVSGKWEPGGQRGVRSVELYVSRNKKVSVWDMEISTSPRADGFVDVERFYVHIPSISSISSTYFPHLKNLLVDAKHASFYVGWCCQEIVQLFGALPVLEELEMSNWDESDLKETHQERKCDAIRVHLPHLRAIYLQHIPKTCCLLSHLHSPNMTTLSLFFEHPSPVDLKFSSGKGIASWVQDGPLAIQYLFIKSLSYADTKWLLDRSASLKHLTLAGSSINGDICSLLLLPTDVPNTCPRPSLTRLWFRIYEASQGTDDVFDDIIRVVRSRDSAAKDGRVAAIQNLTMVFKERPTEIAIAALGELRGMCGPGVFDMQYE